MPNGQPDHTDDDVVAPHRRTWVHSARRASAAVSGPVQAVAFWSAVTLPFVYLPVLLFGLDTRRRAGAFGLLLLAHVIALLIGQSYRSE